MRSATVFPTEVETENYLMRRNIRGASRKRGNGQPPLKSRWSSLSTGNSSNFFPMDVRQSGNGDHQTNAAWQRNNGMWEHAVVDITEDKKGHWITNHFERKECIRYVPDTSKPHYPCFCGRTKDQHISVAVPPEYSDRSSTSPVLQQPVKPWDPNEDLEKSPTDAYGDIVFFPCKRGREKPAKYVRLTEDTDPQHILELLIQQWHLPRPKLVISVTGGAKNFKLNSQDQETFNRGLIRASQATGAWLLTGGTNIGVTKCVGLAVRDGQSMKWVRRKAVQAVNCIGIAPWGYIDNTDRLTSKNGQGLYPALYNINSVITRGRPVPLNPDHTHFILVDNGMKNRYGADMLLRPKIEEALAAPQKELGQGIPVVLVVLEGGTDAITNTKNAISRGIPTVVCDGTGRAADIIAYAHSHATVVDGVRQLASPSSLETLKEKLHAAYDVDYDSKKMSMLVQDVNICIQQEHLVTVFEMDRGENSDLDLAILMALLKGQLASPTQQLSLALSWNRVDVAESKIFTDEIVWPDGSLDPFITSALVHNHVEFLRLFLEHGAIMKEYLTVARLRRLYNAADSDHHIRLTLSKITKNEPHSPIYLQDVGRLLHFLTGAHTEPLYQYDKRVKHIGRGNLALMVLSTSLSGTNIVQKAQEEFLQSEGRDFTTGSKVLSIVELANPGLHFEQPFRELFLWAVLMNRMEMAEFFWERGENPVSAAIAASLIMYKMRKTTTDLDLKQQYNNNAMKFESLATDIMEECHQTDEELAGMLVDCPHTHWKGKNALIMAAAAKDQAFIAHPCCQSVLQRIWKGGLSSNHWLWIKLAIFVPGLIYWLDFKPVTIKDKLRSPHWYEKPLIFYKAPITKFWLYLMSYIAFLMMYSFVLLHRFEEEPSMLDYVLFGWIGTLVIEEIREIIPDPQSNQTVMQKIRKWLKSEWNIIDFFMLTIAIIGFSLHMNKGTHAWARTLYAANGFIFFVRLLRTFAVSDSLGPKMVMIKRMMAEMLEFLCILVVFLVGYGVASQALLYPSQEFTLNSFKNIFYMPYFQIYGELFLDVVVDGACDATQSDTCPNKNPIVPIMLGIYLLLGNVLLLNLLIAIFSSVFEDVQTNSLKIWKYELYFLITEIEDRPTLPPPMAIIEHFFLALRWLYKTFTGCCAADSNTKCKYSESDIQHLQIFEKECAANYRHKKAEKENAEVPERINRIEKRLDELAKHTESMVLQPKLQVKQPAAPVSRQPSGASLTPNHIEQQTLTRRASGTDLPSTQWPMRLPPIQESPMHSPRRESDNIPWVDHNEDMDNVIIDHRAIGAGERVPPDGGSIIAEKHHRRKSRRSNSARSLRRSSSLKNFESPKSKHKSSRHHSDKDSVDTSVSRNTQKSKYSNDPMSDFRLKLYFDSSQGNEQNGQSSERSRVKKKNSHSSSSSSSSEESPRKERKESPRKEREESSTKERDTPLVTNMNEVDDSQIIALQQRMSQLEQSSDGTNNALQRIEQLLQLFIQNKDK